MPKIILPEKVKCHECKGYIFGFPSCSNCEDGYRWDLGDLYRAVEDVGGYLSTVLSPREDEPDYVGTIDFCGEAFEGRGDSYELAAVAVINKVNEEAEDEPSK